MMTPPGPPLARHLYPDLEASGTYAAPHSYLALLEALGALLILVQDQDYAGDTFVCFARGRPRRFGILIIGWGSCDGCDPLLGTSSYQALDALIGTLWRQIVWFDTLDAARAWVHDDVARADSHYASGASWRAFRAAVLAYEQEEV